MSVISNLSLSFGGKVLGAAMQLVGTMIIARLLTPEEFGAFAVSAAAAGLLTALRNFGTSDFLIQSRTVDAESIGSAFFVTAIISWSLALFLFSTRQAQAIFFGAPAVAVILAVLALNFLISPFIMTGTSLMVRDQDFKTIVVFELLCAAIGISMSVLLAFLGFGAISLAIGMTSNSIVMLALILLKPPHGLTYHPSIGRWTEILRFGGWASGITLLNQITGRSPEIVLGRTLGVASAAVYDKGAALSRLVWEQIFGQIVRVLLPSFAQVARNNGDLTVTYFRTVSVLCGLLTPLFVFFAFHAPPIIHILFGEQWAASAPIATWIAVAGAVLSPFAICEQLLIGSGAIRSVFVLKLIQTTAMLSALLVLVHFGLNVASTSFLFSSLVYVLASQKITIKHLKSDRFALFRALAPSLTIVLSTSVGGLLSTLLFGYDNTSRPFSHVAVGGALTTCAWLVTAAWIHHPVYLFGKNALVDIINRYRG